MLVCRVCRISCPTEPASGDFVVLIEPRRRSAIDRLSIYFLLGRASITVLL